MDDELQYVINRRNQESKMGNNLEKPGIILKRKKIRDTSEEKEKLQKSVSLKENHNNKRKKCKKIIS